MLTVTLGGHGDKFFGERKLFSLVSPSCLPNITNTPGFQSLRSMAFKPVVLAFPTHHSLPLGPPASTGQCWRDALLADGELCERSEGQTEAKLRPRMYIADTDPEMLTCAGSPGLKGKVLLCL